MKCEICKDDEWVCENHPNVAWEYGDSCCGGAGMPCICSPLHKSKTGIEPEEKK